MFQYVDFNRGATTGYLRYEKPEEVQKARTAAVLADAGGIVVKDYIATLEAVEGAFLFFSYCVCVCVCGVRKKGENGGRG